jgi:hypothetical protein
MGKATVTVDIERLITFLRGRRVLLSTDIARLYGVTPKALVQAVKRNRKRFPTDFMFQLNRFEARSSRSQIVTLKRGGNIKHLPYAFTEQGVAMLSSVLRSPKAIAVNIAIMLAFVELRGALSIQKNVLRKLIALEGRIQGHDAALNLLAQAIREMRVLPEPAPKKVGFRP